LLALGLFVSVTGTNHLEMQKQLSAGNPGLSGLTLFFTYSFLKNGLNRSIGIGNSVVELFSAETSLRV